MKEDSHNHTWISRENCLYQMCWKNWKGEKFCVIWNWSHLHVHVYTIRTGIYSFLLWSMCDYGYILSTILTTYSRRSVCWYVYFFVLCFCWDKLNINTSRHSFISLSLWMYYMATQLWPHLNYTHRFHPGLTAEWSSVRLYGGVLYCWYMEQGKMSC